ncbi:MAG TPA: amidohydrolase family protein [Chloroflexota bacterium]|jgi:predicted TIM-barrel fold metal-dependent hydrolase|nr:amidohydrolase family protein [Chloroflexota bacterium]
MDIVDSQVHLNRIGSQWEQLDRGIVLDYAVATMDALGLSAILIDEWAGFDEKRRHLPGHVLPNGAMRGEHPFSELALATHPDRFAYVARIDPNDPEVESLMAGVRQRPGALCLRIVPIPEVGEVDLFERGGYDGLFAAAQQHRVPIFCWFPGRAHLLAPKLEQFPNLQLVLDHCGVDRARDDCEQQFAGVLELARYPNLALKWCHAPTQFSNKEPYPYPTAQAHLRRALDAFTPQRVMWASDHTQSRVHHSWAEALFYIRDSALFNDLEKEWLLGRTVRSLLGWG